MKWISVTDELPDCIGTYLVFLDNCKICMAFYNSETDWCEMWSLQKLTVQHWRLLPSPPHPIDQPTNYDNLPISRSGMSPGMLALDGGFLGEIEVHYNHLPAEDATGSKEVFEIKTVLINGHALSELSMENWLETYSHQKPEGFKADKYSIKEIISFQDRRDYATQTKDTGPEN